MTPESRARSVPRRAALLGLALLLAGLAAPAPARAQEPAVRVVVALLPFEVHSAGSLEYLETSLVDLLASRLESSGRVEVVQSVVVREAMVEHAAGERTDLALRRLAREVGADYVVAGSLTALAGRFSLDVRVTPVTSAFAAETLVFTADGEDELLDRMNELSERVLGVVTAAPTLVVAGVRFEGPAELVEQPDLADGLATRRGEPYSSTVVRGDLARLGERPGVATATAETERTEEGMLVSFRLVASADLLTEVDAPAGVADRVAEIRIRGNRRIETDAVLARVGTEPGGDFSPGQIAEDVREIYALGFFRDVRVLSSEGPDGRVVTFQVEENPVVRQVTISGNDSVDADKIRDNLTLTTGATLDYPLLFENAARIEALYRAEGYYLARVRHEIEPLSGNAVAVHFEVTEQDKLKLREIAFEGNDAFSDRELRRGMKTRVWRLWSWVTRFIDNSGTYSEPVFAQDLRRVEQRYMDRGYLQVELSEPRVDPLEDGLVVTVEIREGEQYRVGNILVEGDETADVEALREGLRLQEGEIFNRSYLTTDVDKITHHYTDRGFYFASVTPQTALDADELDVDVVYAVEKGPLYFVREIEFEGNTTTVDSVMRREMRLVEGQLYSARALQHSQARIRALGFFEEVNFDPKPTEYEDQIDVDVNVVEKSTGSLSFGAGFSSQDSFLLTGSVSQTNLFGRGYAVQLSVDIGVESQRYFASFQDPYVFGTDWSFGTTIFRTDVQFEDFDLQQTGLDVVFGHALNLEGTTRGFLRYSFSSRDILESRGASAASLIQRQILSDNQTVSLFGVSLRGDTRNDRVVPTQGGQWAVSADFAGLGGFARFLRLEGRIQRFYRAPEWFPIFGERSAFQLAARAGWAIPLNDIADFDLPDVPAGTLFNPGGNLRPLDTIDTELNLPLSERYFLGGLGSYQLRGFRARSVGPRRAIVISRAFGGFSSGTSANNLALPVGRVVARDEDSGLLDAVCNDFGFTTGDGDGECNDLDDEDIDDFEDLDETDVVGGSRFLSLTAEYRFPISETLGLMGIVFLDMGNAFAENENVFDVTNWRYGTGLGVLWFSPFGPLQAFWGIPLNPLEVEDSNVFEFSVGGAGF